MANSLESWLKEFLAKLRSAIRGRPDHEPTGLLPQPDGYEPFIFALTGVRYEGREPRVRQCALREPVWLVRDHNNIHDKYAIKVLNRNNKTLGYVSRHLTPYLATYMDSDDKSLEAVIARLRSSVSGEVIGASVGLYVPTSVFSDLQSKSERFGYFLEVASAGNIYFWLDCDEARLNEVISRLTKEGYPWLRFGIGYGRATDGHQYQWYIVLDDSVATERLEQFIRENADIVPAPEPSLDDWIEGFDVDRTELSARNSNLREQVSYLESKVAMLEDELQRAKETIPETEMQVRRLERQVRRQLRSQEKDDFRQLVAILLPSVELLRDSLDVATIEYVSYLQVFGTLSGLVHDPGNVKGERVASAHGWKEMHCSTGQKNDGRIYYKQDDSRWLVLISFKHAQKKDMEYLKSY